MKEGVYSLSARRFKGEVTPWVCECVVDVGSFKEAFRIRHLSPSLNSRDERTIEALLSLSLPLFSELKDEKAGDMRRRRLFRLSADDTATQPQRCSITITAPLNSNLSYRRARSGVE